MVAHRLVAAGLLVTYLSGCSVNLGTAYPQRGETPTELEVATTRCEHEATMAWDGSFGKQAGAFFLGFTIIGFPAAIAWERSVKRETWQSCMKNRGYRVVPPGGEKASAPKVQSYRERIAQACVWSLTEASWGRCAMEHGATSQTYCGDIESAADREKCSRKFDAAVAAAERTD
jgi:hypothetical protein